MVHYHDARLDRSFLALADATRRGILERLGQCEATISDLAHAFDMTLTGIKKHVQVLEAVGLVVSEKNGRTRTCRLGTYRLEEEALWMDRTRQLWSARFTALDAVMEDLKQERSGHGRQDERSGGDRS